MHLIGTPKEAVALLLGQCPEQPRVMVKQNKHHLYMTGVTKISQLRLNTNMKRAIVSLKDPDFPIREIDSGDFIK